MSGNSPLEGAPDSFETRRHSLYARIGAFRKITGDEIDEYTRSILDDLHTAIEGAQHGDKGALNRAEETLEELEDALDSDGMF